ncbi:MAG: hypothetical protein ACTSU5_10060, partial [Promethearchaeota archaeon]
MKYATRFPPRRPVGGVGRLAAAGSVEGSAPDGRGQQKVEININIYVKTHIHMASKLISIREDLYHKLREMKGPDDSF